MPPTHLILSLWFTLCVQYGNDLLRVCIPMETTNSLKAGLFVKDVFLARNTQHSVVEKESNSCTQTSYSNMGRMGNNTQGSWGHRTGIMMIVSWLREGPSGVRQLLVLLFGESLLFSVLRSQNRDAH